jgi:hypothetical protein
MINPRDLAEIMQVLSRYSMAMDLRRWELMDEVFLPDAEIVMNGAVLKPSYRGIAVIRNAIEFCSYTQHLNGTTLVEKAGDRVIVTTNVRAWHRGGENDGKSYEAIGRYVDLFVLTPKGWRIARRDEQIPIFIGDATLLDVVAPTLARMIEETAAEFPTLS